MPTPAGLFHGLPPQVSPPQFALSEESPAAFDGAEAIALPVLRDPRGSGYAAQVLLGPGADDVGDRLGLDLLGLLDDSDEPARAGEILRHRVATPDPDAHAGVRHVFLVGVGDQSADDLRRAGAALARAATDLDTLVTSVPAIAAPRELRAFVVGVMLGSYGFHWRSAGPRHRPVQRVVLAGLFEPEAYGEELRRALAVGGAGWLARTLATVPSNLKNPAWLATQAISLSKETGLECTVWDEHQLAKRGMGGILGVGQASATPPRLIRLDYTPSGGGRRTPRVVLVGKGITFDSGGLSIKPAESMATMKRDMTGGGVVLATMGALAEMGCPVRVTGLIAAAENAVGAGALRPGDVVTHFGGRTSEVMNTDAEGRLVLADAIAYAAAELKPRLIVDIATLTGAAKVALGQQLGAVFATDDAVADRLLAAGRAAGEPLWRLPLVEDYEDKLSSKVADSDNAPGGPGAIIAALFLRHFTAGVPWAHLDIASVGDAREDRFEWSQGPTGFGARLLLEWLGGADPLDGLPG